MRRVNEARALLVLVALILVGCEARSSVEAAQTAVVAVQTVLPFGQFDANQLESLLAGVSLEVQTQPEGVSNDAVTSVTIEGTDNQDRLAQVDLHARQAAATGALVLASQYYPNATISLSVSDSSGSVLIKGTKAPGQPPSLQ